MIAGENASEVAGEIVEQAKLSGGGRNGFTANGKNHGCGIDGNVADLERTWGQWPLEAAQHRLDARDEFARAKRFGNVIVSADFKAEHAIGLTAFCGKENYRN